MKKNTFIYFLIFYLTSFSSFSENSNERFFACGTKNFMNQIQLPSRYEDYLKDQNEYYNFTESFIFYDWNWKKGEFLNKTEIKDNNENFIHGRVFLKSKNVIYVKMIFLDKYSLKLRIITIPAEELKKKEPNWDKAIYKRDMDCMKISSKNLFKLKNRF